MNEEFYISLIQKSLSGTISEDEKLELDQWMSSSTENAETYADMKLAWENLPSPRIKVDSQAAWEDLDKRITDKPKSKIITFRRISAIAASLLILAFPIWWIQSDNGYTEIIANEDNVQYELPDHSIVTLKKGSYVKYKKNFNSEREVVFEGEGLFSVTHDAEHPFKIQGPDLNVTVLGTEFLFRDSQKDEKGNVQLIEGSVSVFSRQSQKPYLLKPQEQFVLNGETEEKLLRIKLNDVGWLSPQFNFKNIDLSDVINKVESFYGVTIIASNLEGCKFTGDLSNLDLPEIIRNISILYSAEIKEVNGGYELIEGECQ